MEALITLADYWMGRDKDYPADLTPMIIENANNTIDRWNALLLYAEKDFIVPINPNTGSQVASGWRPPEVNDATSNAAATSKHLTGRACDVYDPAGILANWIKQHLDKAESIGLWFEDFRCTNGWCHGQTVPPGSGNRIYVPSLAWARKLNGMA